MKIQALLIIIVIAAIFAVWKLVTAKIVKVIVELSLIVALLLLIVILATGNEDKLPGGENFEKCAYDNVKTDYFCINHAQWECEDCHKKYD